MGPRRPEAHAGTMTSHVASCPTGASHVSTRRALRASVAVLLTLPAVGASLAHRTADRWHDPFGLGRAMGSALDQAFASLAAEQH